LRVQGLGLALRVCGPGFGTGVKGVGLRVDSFGFGVQGSRSRALVKGVRFRVWGWS